MRPHGKPKLELGYRVEIDLPRSHPAWDYGTVTAAVAGRGTGECRVWWQRRYSEMAVARTALRLLTEVEYRRLMDVLDGSH